MELWSQLPARSGRRTARAKSRIFYFEHNKGCDRAVDAALLIASLEELLESVISVGWNFNATPLELDNDHSSDDDEFELTLDSDSEEWDEECVSLAPEGDLEVNKCRPFYIEEKQTHGTLHVGSHRWPCINPSQSNDQIKPRAG
jgi:hypothetical protein